MWMAAPEGFAVSNRFPGFEVPDIYSSILLSEIPASLADVLSRVEREQLGSQALTEQQREQVSIDGYSGVLILADQQVDEAWFQKWILILGDENRSLTAVGSYPDALASRLSTPVRASLETISWRPDSAEQSPGFQVTETDRLKVVSRSASAVVLASAGAELSAASTDARVVVTRARMPVTIDNLEDFALARLLQTQGLADLSNLESAPVTVGMLPGWELIADARLAESDTPITIYQALVVRENSYFLVMAISAQSEFDSWIDEFFDVPFGLFFD